MDIGVTGNTGPLSAQQPQQRLGKYELRQQVGRGNVGDVWKSYDFQARKEVALKLIHSDLQADPHFFQRFTTEGHALSVLRHENIVPVHEIAVTRPQETHTVAYIASDFIEGQTLTAYINKTSRKGLFPSLNDIVYLFTSLGVAIDYAHEQGIVHGDLKPNNILLNAFNTQHFSEGEPMLTDIGLPHLIGDDASVCSPLYMSPEQAKGEPAGNRSDIYSLGVILYEICTGVQPFRDSSSVAVLMQHIGTLPTPPLLINPQLPPALSEVILRALAKDPALRFSMASLFATAIADACSIRPTIPISRDALAEEELNYFSATDTPIAILGVSQPTGPTPRSKPPISSPSHPRIAARESSLSYSTRPSQAIPALSAQQQVDTHLRTSSQHRIPASGTPQTTPSTPVPVPSTPSTPQTVSTTSASYTVPKAEQMQAFPPVTTPRPVSPALSPSSSNIPVMPSFAAKARSRRRDLVIYAVVGLLLLAVLIAGGIAGNLILRQSSVVGHVFFQNDAFGVADELRLDMSSIDAPGSGQVYRAWLETDTQHVLPLGTLSQSGSNANLLYKGDTQHTNLLSIARGVVVTREDSNSAPTAIHGDTIYQSSFDAQALPYIRNILYQTPQFPSSLGVVVGLYQTMQSMDDKAGSIVDSIQGTHDLGMAKRQAIRVLELIDGTQYAMDSGDLPRGTQSNVDAKAGLISSPTQPGYIDTLSTQLDKLQAVVGDNTTLMQHIQNVRNAIDDLRSWIQQARSYDIQLVKGQDLTSPSMVDAALHVKQLVADAYTGKTIPPNDSPLPVAGSAGAYQAYVECEYLATLDMKHA